MRYLAPLIFIGLFALGIHFVNKNTPLLDDSDSLEGKAQALQEQLDEKLGGAIPEGSIPTSLPLDISDQDSEIQLGERNENFPEEEDFGELTVTGDEQREDDFEQDSSLSDDQELEEYAEEVSDEDFGEFLGAALEEISEDPEMAKAIVVEMAKIYQVQPNHQQKILQFYEDCARSSKIPNEIKNICDRERYNLK